MVGHQGAGTLAPGMTCLDVNITKISRFPFKSVGCLQGIQVQFREVGSQYREQTGRDAWGSQVPFLRLQGVEAVFSGYTDRRFVSQNKRKGFWQRQVLAQRLENMEAPLQSKCCYFQACFVSEVSVLSNLRSQACSAVESCCIV